MDLNGTDQFINLDFAAIPDSTNFTITSWVNIDTVTGGSTSHAIVHLGDNTTPYNGVRLQIKRGTDGGRIGAYDPDAAADDFSAAVAITVDQWDLAAIRGTKTTIATIGILGGTPWVVGTTHTAETGTNRLLIFCASNETSTAGVILNTVTYGTQSLVKIGDETVDDTDDGRVEMWRLLEAGIASASSSTFVPTWSSTPGDHDPLYASAFFENIDQTTPTGDTKSEVKIGTNVALLGSYTTSTNTTSYTHATPAGTNRILIYHGTHNDSGTDSTINTITYGGQTMTFVGQQSVGSGPYNSVSIFYLNEAGIVAAGSSTVAYTWTPEGTPDRQIHATAFFSNADQSNPIDGYVDAEDAAANVTLATAAITTTDADMVIAVSNCGQSTTYTPNNGFTEGFDTTNSAHTATGIYQSATGANLTPSVTKAITGDIMVISAARINSNGVDGEIRTSAAITNDNNEMIVAVAMVGSFGGTFSPNNSFIEGVDTAGNSSRIVTIYKSTTGADETPSVTHIGPNRMAIFGAELNQFSITGVVDVSVNGDTWTNLITGTTSGWTVGSSNLQSIGRELKDGSTDLLTDGSIADVRCYDRQLSQAEIASIYAAQGKDGIIDGLLAQWPCRNGAIGTSPPVPTVTFVASTTISNLADSTEDSVSPAVPTHVTGDLILAVVGAGSELDNAVGVAVTADQSGWTLLNTGDHPVFATSFTTPTLYIYIRTATSSEPGTYTFTAAANNPMIGHMITYRSLPTNFGVLTSAMTKENSAAATSPLNAITETLLVVRVACVDGQSLPGTPDNFYPSGTNGRQREENGAANPNGCTLGIADELGASSVVARDWTHTSEENGAVTITFVANEIIDVSGATGSPHRGQSVQSPTYIETELR